MSYCTLTLSNKPANPSVQPAPRSDFYWPKRQKWQICWGTAQELNIFKENLPKQKALLHLSLIQSQKRAVLCVDESYAGWMGYWGRAESFLPDRDAAIMLHQTLVKRP
ncbi:hypothetical protein QQF64_025188 [Cirrhinus molitorella]|uniref:Uncharacterized protein n=1 Tax=Cirrhinus molitorella TaxID=172907 RepID=A0ABR3NPP4_9TELE